MTKRCKAEKQQSPVKPDKAGVLDSAVAAIAELEAALSSNDSPGVLRAAGQLSAWRDGIKSSEAVQQWERRVREDAALRSRRIMAGKTVERFVPFLSGCTYTPQDMSFMASPIDYLVFNGMAAGEVNEIVLLEVKTGCAQLTERQRQIRQVVNDGRVRWHELHVGAHEYDWLE